MNFQEVQDEWNRRYRFDQIDQRSQRGEKVSLEELEEALHLATLLQLGAVRRYKALIERVHRGVN